MSALVKHGKWTIDDNCRFVAYFVIAFVPPMFMVWVTGWWFGTCFFFIFLNSWDDDPI